MKRPPRTTSLAFAKFKKITNRIGEAAGISYQLTKAAHAELQKMVETTFDAALINAVDTMSAKTLSVKDIQRVRTFLRAFAGSGRFIPVLTMTKSVQVQLPKKMGMKRLKTQRPKTRVTSTAVHVIGLLYTDLIKIALGNLEAEQGKKRIAPDMLRDQLKSVPCFVVA